MQVNGKIPDINYAPFNSQASMVISVEQENESFIYHYIEVNSEVTYIKDPSSGATEGEDLTEIVGTVLSANTIKETVSNDLIVIPINALIKTSDSFIGRTVINDDGNLDIKYTAEDMQVIVANQTISGFAIYGNINEEVVATGGMNIRVGRLSGVVDGISFYFNKNIDVLIETGGSSRRIDTIVIRKNQANRKVSVEVKKGSTVEPNAGKPPKLIQNFLGVYEIPICDVVVDVKQKNLQQNNITDRRNTTSKIGSGPLLLENKMILNKEAKIESSHGDYFLLNGQSVNIDLYPEAKAALVAMGLIPSSATTINLPDYRGMYPRMAGVGVTGETGSRNKSWELGSTDSDSIGTTQSDAIRNIEGTYTFVAHDNYIPVNHRSSSGAFGWVSHVHSRGAQNYGAKTGYQGISFNASKVVPTADTNHPHNFTTNFYIYFGKPKEN